LWKVRKSAPFEFCATSAFNDFQNFQNIDDVDNAALWGAKYICYIFDFKKNVIPLTPPPICLLVCKVLNKAVKIK
jgi:hypothetical protein